MQYTTSANFSTDSATGHRHHDATLPIPTAWSSDDANQLIWSLMEVVNAAGVTPKAFDKADASSYRVLLTSLQSLFADSASGMRVGDLKWSTGTSARNFMAPNGAVVSRSAYADLWTFAQSSGNLVSEAAWAGGAYGSYSTGDGATTFRIPNLWGIFLRALNTGGSGYDASRVIGSVQTDMFKAHFHDFYASETSDYSYTGPDDERNSGYRQQTYQTSTVGGSETRPVNIALPIWLKYR